MPLFPIEAHLSSESTATLDQLPEKIRSDAPASTSKEGAPGLASKSEIER